MMLTHYTQVESWFRQLDTKILANKGRSSERCQMHLVSLIDTNSKTILTGALISVLSAHMLSDDMFLRTTTESRKHTVEVSVYHFPS